MNCPYCGKPFDCFGMCVECETMEWDQNERFGHPGHGPYPVELPQSEWDRFGIWDELNIPMEERA
jgi:hypothetical protein